MTYVLVYGNLNSEVLGKHFDSKDVAFLEGYSTIKDYYSGKDNRTEEIFGTDIEIENNKQDNEIYDFYIYKVTKRRLKLIDHINVRLYLELESKVGNGEVGRSKTILAYTNKIILTRLKKRKEHEYFYDLVASIFIIDSMDDIEEAEEYIIDSYISLIKIGHFRNYQKQVLQYESLPIFDVQSLIANLSFALQGTIAVDHSIGTLILYLWYVVEKKHGKDFVEYVNKGVQRMAGLYKD